MYRVQVLENSAGNIYVGNIPSNSAKISFFGSGCIRCTEVIVNLGWRSKGVGEFIVQRATAAEKEAWTALQKPKTSLCSWRLVARQLQTIHCWCWQQTTDRDVACAGVWGTVNASTHPARAIGYHIGHHPLVHIWIQVMGPFSKSYIHPAGIPCELQGGNLDWFTSFFLWILFDFQTWTLSLLEAYILALGTHFAFGPRGSLLESVGFRPLTLKTLDWFHCFFLVVS